MNSKIRADWFKCNLLLLYLNLGPLLLLLSCFLISTNEGRYKLPGPDYVAYVFVFDQYILPSISLYFFITPSTPNGFP